MDNNEKKVCFIVHTDNERYLNECISYIAKLIIPDGFEIELLTVKKEENSAKVYNEAMHFSDAKYKVYLQQETFIIDVEFITKIVKVFKKNADVGMIGLVGVKKLAKDGIVSHETCFGALAHNNIYKELEKVDGQMQEVDVVDGSLMATQYDIEWRQDLELDEYFSKVSQCIEFKNKNLKITIPAQEKPWAVFSHRKSINIESDKYRQKFLEAYPEISTQNGSLRVLFIRSKQIGILGLAAGLIDLGHNVTIWDKELTLFVYNEKESEMVEEEIEEGHYDLVCTYDFCPSVAEACQKCKMKYYSWVYDSPLMELYTKYSRYEMCHISVFDKKQFERLKYLKIKNLYYHPLASEIDIFGSVSIKKKDEKKYKSDVSFVGRLYNNRGYEELFSTDDEKLRKEADEVVSSCKCIWNGKDNIFGKASEELVDFISKKYDDSCWKIYDIDKRYYCESMKLVRRCNELERVEILQALAEKFSVTLYTDTPYKVKLKGVKQKPWLDYWVEMPKAFYLSKINLNITSRSIESGIPQRVIDIMAVGGFVLTNYQTEIEEYFEIGKEIEVYHNIPELIEKVDYYLRHEEQRIRIAINGYQKVRKDFTYKKALEDLLPLINP